MLLISTMERHVMKTKALELYFSIDKNKNTLDVIEALLNGETSYSISKWSPLSKQTVYNIEQTYVLSK